MAKWEKFRRKLLSGASDANVRFDEMIAYLERLGFEVDTKGSHRVCSREGIIEVLVLQPLQDGSAKPYQVKQVRQMLQENALGAEHDEV